MFKRVVLLIVIAVLALGLSPVAVSAQSPNDDEPYDTLIRVNGPVHIAAGQTAQGVVVISDNALIEGTVDYLVVIDGDATISGTVTSQVYMVNGTLTLKEGARVDEEVLLYRADVVEEGGVTVVGGIHEEWGGFNVGRGLFFGLWVSMTIAVLAAGVIFAAFGGRQLVGPATAFTNQIGPSLLTALVLWVGVPVVAVLGMATVIGIPLGLGVLVFLLPALWFIGYLVAGAAVGGWIVKWRGRDVGAHPYAAVIVGLIALQLLAVVPFLGGTVAFVAGLIGGGALVYRAYAAFRGTTPRPIAGPAAPAAPTA